MKTNVQTNLLGRSARIHRKHAPPVSGSVFEKQWDHWGEIVVVRVDKDGDLMITLCWPDGALDEIGLRWLDVRKP